MIKDPPVMTIRRGFGRPKAKDLAAFANAQTGPVVDAMGGRGALDHRNSGRDPGDGGWQP